MQPADPFQDTCSVLSMRHNDPTREIQVGRVVVVVFGPVAKNNIADLSSPLVTGNSTPSVGRSVLYLQIMGRGYPVVGVVACCGGGKDSRAGPASAAAAADTELRMWL